MIAEMATQIWEPWLSSIRQSGLSLWVLSAGSLACASMALLVSRRKSIGQDPIGLARWRYSALIWFVCAIEFAWRLEILLASLSRFVISALGWYGDRRYIQVAALMGAGIALVWFGRRFLPTASFPTSPVDTESVFFLMTGGMLAMLLIRASSLHHLDLLLAERFLAISMGRWFEVFFFAVALVCAAKELPRH